MGHLLSFFIDRHKAFLFLVALSAYAGFSYFFSGIKDIIPTKDSRVVEVKSQYPGATALEIEGLVNIPIESFLETIKGYREIVSHSTEGSGRVLFQIDPDYGGSITEIVEEIRSAVKRISYFPEDMDKKPIVSLLSYYRDPFFYISIHGKDKVDNVGFANALMDKVRGVSGVASVESIGYDEMEVWIEAIPEELRRHDITMAELKDAVKKRNINLTGGKIKANGVEFLIRTSKEYKSLQEIEETVVESNDYGNAVRVRDVARVTWRPKRVPIQLSTNEEPSIFLAVYKTDSSNVLKTSKDVEKVVEEVKKSNPSFANKLVSVDFVKDKTIFLANRYHLLIFFFSLSFVLMLILFTLYKGISFSFWAFASFFSSLGITFLLMEIFGLGFNLITLYLLFLSNIIFQYASIVVLKEFFKFDVSRLSKADFSEKLSRFSPPFFTAFFMFVVISSCFFYFKIGSVGIFHVVFKMVLFMAFSAFIVNFLFLPALYFSFQHNSQFLKSPKFEDFFKKMGGCFTSASQFFLDHSKVIFGCRLFVVVVVFLFSLIFLPKGAFLDRSQTVNVSLLYPSFYSEKKSAEETRKIVKNLREAFEGKNYVYYSTFNSLSPLKEYLGQTRSYWMTISIETPHQISSSLIDEVSQIVGKDSKEYGFENFRVTEDRLYEELPSSAVRIRLLSNDLEDFYNIKTDILPSLSQLPNIQRIESLYDTGLESIVFRVNNEKAIRTGVSISSVAVTLSDSFEGSKVTTTNEILSKNVDIRVLFDQNKLEFRDMKDFMETFNQLYVINARGESVPIKSFTEINKDVSYPFIERVNNQRVMDIDLYPSGSNLVSYVYNLYDLHKKVNESFSSVESKYPNVIFKTYLNASPLKDAASQSIFFFLSAILIAFFVMVSLFKSYSISFAMLASTVTTIATMLAPLVIMKVFSFFFNIPEIFYTVNFFFLILVVAFACLSVGNTTLLHYDIAYFYQNEKNINQAVILSVEKRNSFFMMQFLYFFVTLSLFCGFSFLFHDTLMTYFGFLMLAGLVGTQLSTLTYPVYYMLSTRLLDRLYQMKASKI